MTSVSIPRDGAPLPAYLSVPVPTADRPGPWPGVVVLHEAFGVNDDIKDQADWLAAAGYVAVVPDLFSRGGALRCLKATFQQLRARRGPVFDEIDLARTWVAGRPDCTGTTGVIGFCMGGGFALLVAGRPGWSAASVNYGQVPDDTEDVLAGACPVVASFGGADKGLQGAAAQVEHALATAGVPHDVKEYPGAGHSFINRIGGGSPLMPLLRVAGIGHHHEAAADARRRILAFFAEHLHAQPASS